MRAGLLFPNTPGTASLQGLQTCRSSFRLGSLSTGLHAASFLASFRPCSNVTVLEPPSGKLPSPESGTPFSLSLVLLLSITLIRHSMHLFISFLSFDTYLLNIRAGHDLASQLAFQQLDRDIPRCAFLQVSSLRASWSFLDLWVGSFHQIWKTFSRHFFKYFFPPSPSESQLHRLSHWSLRSCHPQEFFALCISF